MQQQWRQQWRRRQWWQWRMQVVTFTATGTTAVAKDMEEEEH
jgi:hypothetical protein